MDEYYPPTVDDFAAYFALSIASPSGSQLGWVTSAVSDAVNFVVGEVGGVGGAAYNAISGVLGDLTARVWTAVSSALGFVLKWAYGYLRSFLLGFVEASYRGNFPEVGAIFGVDPLYLLGLNLSLVAHAAMGAVTSGVQWVYGGIRDSLGYVAFGYASVVHAIVVLTQQAAQWAYNGIRDSLGYVRLGFDTIASAVQSMVSAAATWTYNGIRDGLGYVRLGFDTVASAVQSMVSAAASWLWTQISKAAGVAIDLAGGVVSPLTAQISQWAHWLWTQISAALGVGIDLAGLVVSPVKKAIDDAAQWVWNNVSVAIAAIPGLVTGIISTISQAPGSLFDLIKKAVQDSADWLWKQVSAALGVGIDLAGSVVSPVKNAITDAAQWLWGLIQGALGPLVNTLVGGAQGLLSGLVDMLKEAFQWVVGGLGKLDNWVMPDPLSGFLGGLGPAGADMRGLWSAVSSVSLPSGFDIFAVVAYPFVVIATTLAVVNAMAQIYARPIIQEYNREYPTNAPPISLLERAFRRGLISPSVAADWLAKEGFPPEFAADFIETWMAVPSVDLGIQMRHRGLITDGDLAYIIKANGIDPRFVDGLTGVGYNLLGIRQIDRVYKAGLLSIGDLEKQLEQLGYRPDQAALEAQAIAALDQVQEPGKKGVLKNLTESQIRTAYARRLITKDAALADLGAVKYSADEAALIVATWDLEFVANPNLRGDSKPKELGRALIEGAYKRRMVDANKAAAELEQSGYTPEDAQIILSMVDLDLAQQATDAEIKVATEEFHAGVIDAAAYAARLAELHVPQDRIDLDVKTQTLVKRAKTARLTEAQCAAAYKKGIIPESDFRNRLDALGYNAVDLEILVALNTKGA